MATVIGDFASDPSRFRHNMVFQSQHPPQQSHHPQSLRSSSRPRDAPSSSYRHQQQPPPPPSSSSPPSSTSLRHPDHGPSHPQRATPTTDQPRPTAGWADAKHARDQDGASRFPTPPDSSSPSASNSASARPQDAAAAAAAVVPSAHMDTSDHHNGVATPFSTSSTAVASSASTVVQGKSPTPASERPAAANSIPSPASDSFPPWAAPDSPVTRPVQSDVQTQQTTIRVHDLAHIQSLARADLVTGNGPGLLNDPPLSQMKYDISEMPIGDIIEMVAALLTKITTTNDLQHDALNRNATHQRQAQQAQQHSEPGSGEGSSSSSGGSGAAGAGAGSPYANSVLAFHGKNVPAITILSYLSRIHKYCPTTFEVFLSLLAYFDRMTDRVNELVAKSEEEKQGRSQRGLQSKKRQHDGEDVIMGGDDDDEADHGGDGARENDGDETDEDLADSSDEGDGDHDSVRGGRKRARGSGSGKPAASSKEAVSLASSTATYFVVDSYNIHRLIIAGVTCASKFFSDVFYTNSRYAKVGGLPLAELNHLELQFLLLNDFRLAVPVEDLEAYATMLVEFYAREVVGQRSRPTTGPAE